MQNNENIISDNSDIQSFTASSRSISPFELPASATFGQLSTVTIDDPVAYMRTIMPESNMIPWMESAVIKRGESIRAEQIRVEMADMSAFESDDDDNFSILDEHISINSVNFEQAKTDSNMTALVGSSIYDQIADMKKGVFNSVIGLLNIRMPETSLYDGFIRSCEYEGITEFIFYLPIFIGRLEGYTILQSKTTPGNTHRQTNNLIGEFLYDLYHKCRFQRAEDADAYLELADRMCRNRTIANWEFMNILVCVELNPGPDNYAAFMRENDKIIERFYPRFLRFVQIHPNPEHCVKMLSSCSIYRKFVSEETNIPCSSIVLLCFVYGQLDTLETVYAPNNNGFLVGIETNPGPSVLSTTKSFSSDVVAQMQFPLNFGFNAQTTETVEEMIQKLDILLKNGINVNHDVNPSVLANTIDPLVAKLKEHNPVGKSFKIALAIVGSIIAAYVAFKVGAVISKVVVSLLCCAQDSDLQPVLEPFCGVQAQIGTHDIVTGLLGYLYLQVANSSLKDGDLNAFMKGAERLGKQKEGLVSFIDFLLTVLQRFSDEMTKRFNLPNFAFKGTGDSNIDEIQGDLNLLLAKLRSEGLYNAENGKIAYEIEARIRKLKAGMPRSRDFAPQHRAIYDLELALKPVIQRFERNNIVGNGPRSEPLGIMLGGPSGVGKSTATVPILLAVMAQTLPQERMKAFYENHSDFIWNFVPENHFHDAFHGQFCTIIDEAGFCKDSVGMPDPGAMGAIRFINTACFPLTMAHLEDKGNTNFNSEIVFATTNRNFFRWESMYSSEAYVRRFRVAMLAVPKEKYCLASSICEDPWKRRLDLKKIPQGVIFSEDVPEYIPWDYLNGCRASGEILDFAGLVKLLVEEYNRTKTKGTNLLSAHQELKFKYASSRLDAQIGDDDSDDFDFSPFANIDFFNLGFSTPVKALATCVTIAAGAWYVLRKTILDQSGDVHGKAKSPRKMKKAFKARKANVKNLNAQFGANANSVNGARKIMKRSVYKMYCQGFPDASVYATFVKGRVFVAPAHFFHAVQTFIDDGLCGENPTVVFERCTAPSIGFEISFDDLDVIDVRDDDQKETDMFYCIVPSIIPSHPDIRSCFKPINEDATRSKFDAMLVKQDGKDLTFMCTQAYPAGSISYHPFESGDSFKYNLPTRKGDCGSLLFVTGPTAGKPVIVGIHVAGNEKNLGYATRIDYEAIEAVCLMCEAPIYTLDDAPDVDAQMGDNFIVAESLENLPLPTSNMVVRSPLYGKFNEPKCAPTMLRSLDLGNGLMDPWANARSKYSRFQRCVDLDLLDIVGGNVSQMVLYSKKSDDPWDSRLFTFQEAVQGIPGVQFVEGIPRNTSAGFPFSLHTNLKGKRDWFGTDGIYDFSSEKCLALQDSISQSIVKLEQGFRMNVKYADYLKDERRPIQKVIDGKTRLISASPLDYLIICRMYFGDFVRACMSGRITNEMAIGVNPYSSEWGFMTRHLQSVGSKCIFGDYSAYDGSIPIAFMYRALDIVEDFYRSSPDYKTQDSVVRAALFEDIVNSKHVAVKDGKTFSYEWFGSNPSGNFLTTILNSLCNLMLIRYAAVNIVVNKGLYKSRMNAMSDFNTNVRCIVFGDDNGMCVSDKWAEFLDQESFTVEMKKIGMVYTDESKSLSNDFKHRPLTECTFLKRAFRFDEAASRWDAPLEVSTIEEMCNWTKKGCTKKDVMATVDTALMEASFHGKDYYNEFSTRLRSATLEALESVPMVNFRLSLEKARGCEMNY